MQSNPPEKTRKKAPRSRLDVAQRRAQILAAARVVFDREHYAAVTMADVAERSGVSRALLFHYFESKRGLYLAVLSETAEELFALGGRHSELPAHEGFVAGVADYFSYVDRHAVRFSALLGGGLGADPEVQAVMSDYHERHARRIAQRAGLHLEDDPRSRAALHGFLGYCEALGMDYLRHNDLSILDLTRLAVRAAASGFPAMAPALERALEGLDAPGGRK